jgi:hypothetical protein
MRLAIASIALLAVCFLGGCKGEATDEGAASTTPAATTGPAPEPNPNKGAANAETAEMKPGVSHEEAAARLGSAASKK